MSFYTVFVVLFIYGEGCFIFGTKREILYIFERRLSKRRF